MHRRLRFLLVAFAITTVTSSLRATAIGTTAFDFEATRADARWERGAISEGGRNGGMAAVFKETGEATGNMVLTVPVGPRDLVEVGAWGRTVGVDGPATVRIEWTMPPGTEPAKPAEGGRARDTISTWLATEPLPRAGQAREGEWLELGARALAPTGATHARVRLTAKTGAGTAWFDDLSVRVVPPADYAGELQREPRLRTSADVRPEEFVRISDGHLSRNGQRVRFWGSQGKLSGLTHADTDHEVATFARAGFNLFRSLQWSDSYAKPFTPGDLSSADRFHYTLGALSRNGVAFWMDGLNACRIDESHVDAIDDPATAAEWTEAVRMLYPKGTIIRTAYPAVWDPRMRATYKKFIRDVANLRSPYTGLAFGEDPNIVMWELTNEYWWTQRMMLGAHLKMPPFFRKQLQAQWVTWLKGKYADDDAMRSAWGTLLPGEGLSAGNVAMAPLERVSGLDEMTRATGIDLAGLGDVPLQAALSSERRADVLEFLTTLLRDFKTEALAEFRAQGRPGIGAAVVPVVSDTEHSGTLYSQWPNLVGDMSTVALYLDMSTHDRTKPTFPFASGLKEPAGTINDWFDNKRVAGQASVVYETMIFHPQKYRAEYPWRLLARCAVQDFDVISFHYWGHPRPYPHLGRDASATAIVPMAANAYTEGLFIRYDPVLTAVLRTTFGHRLRVTGSGVHHLTGASIKNINST